MNDTIALSPLGSKVKILLAVTGLTILFGASVLLLELDILTFLERSAQAGQVVSNFMVFDMTDISEILKELVISIGMAIASLVIGALISFVLACLGASNIAPSKLGSSIIKSVVSVIRAIPSLVWILMIVAVLGFGSLSGVTGLVIPTVGYLTKSFMSSIEEVSPNVLETMKTAGASWYQLIVEGILPNVVEPFTTWLAIRLEGNVAESISLGVIGASGIGTVLSKAISTYNYGKITMCILAIFTTMVLFELSVNKIKKKQVIG